MQISVPRRNLKSDCKIKYAWYASMSLLHSFSPLLQVHRGCNDQSQHNRNFSNNHWVKITQKPLPFSHSTVVWRHLFSHDAVLMLPGTQTWLKDHLKCTQWRITVNCTPKTTRRNTDAFCLIRETPVKTYYYARPCSCQVSSNKYNLLIIFSTENPF